MSVLVMVVVSYVAWLLTSAFVSLPIFLLNTIRLPLWFVLTVVVLVVLWGLEE